MIRQNKELSNQRHNAPKDSFNSAKVRSHCHYKIKTNHKRANTPKTHKTKPPEIKLNKKIKINFSSYTNTFY